ncbi:hypothetical protein QTP88_007533 [Uroleucon formosanum]
MVEQYLIRELYFPEYFRLLVYLHVVYYTITHAIYASYLLCVLKSSHRYSVTGISYTFRRLLFSRDALDITNQK